jgi:hypothetical protein
VTTGSIAPDDRRTAFAKGLRELADVLERSPESVPLPYDGVATGLDFMFLFGDDPRADMAEAARTIPCNWQKRVSSDADGGNFYLDGQLHGLKLTLIAQRGTVCERVVKGTEDREVEEVIEPAKTRTVVKPVEIVEWVCHPVLSPAAKADAEPESDAAA